MRDKRNRNLAAGQILANKRDSSITVRVENVQTGDTLQTIKKAERIDISSMRPTVPIY